MFTDSVNQPIAPGDWVVYAKSGYARIAKILDIKPTGQVNWRQMSQYRMVVMTAAEGKTYKREYDFCPWNVNKPMQTSSVIRIDRPPIAEEQLIEARIARM